MAGQFFSGFVVLIIFSNVFDIKVESCTVLQDINGCSTPLQLDMPFKKVFTPACNAHDVCYRCGEHYGWSQTECDDSFLKQLKSICTDLHGNNTSSTRLRRGLTDYLKAMKEKFTKIYEGWKKATENQTTKEEAKRLWGEAKLILKMLFKWSSIKDQLQSCTYGAEIYHKTVMAFGVYAYRVKSKPFCTESCAKTLGNPFQI